MIWSVMVCVSTCYRWTARRPRELWGGDGLHVRQVSLSSLFASCLALSFVLLSASGLVPKQAIVLLAKFTRQLSGGQRPIGIVNAWMRL